MTPSRRTVLQGGLAGMVGALLPLPGLRRLAFAGEDQPMLLVVHLRGGADGLHLISPSTDPVFIEARVSELRVEAEGADAGHALANGPDASIDFRLHKSADGLSELYQSGQLAFIHAAGLTNGTRSHFVATDMIERGVADAGALAHSTSGWLAREIGPGNRLAASVNGVLAGELTGAGQAIAVPDLNSGLQPAGGPQVGEVLRRLYAADGSPVAAAGRAALDNMARIDHHLVRNAKGQIEAYQAESAAHYETAGDFARPLKAVAQLIKLDLGLSAATVDIGGWDTHEFQAGRFKTATERLSNGLAAFWNDISAYHDRVVVVTISEFGRRLRSNRSNGTDHGRGGVMAVLGGKLHGGRCYGGWPGLSPEHLDEGVDLAVATDYRRVLTELLEMRAGRRVDGVFPGYAYSGPLGLFGARA